MKNLILIALIGLSLSLSKSRQTIVDCAKANLGVRYEDLDCSGLTRKCYRKVGVELSTIAHNQFTKGRAVTRDQLQPGDIVGFNNHDGKQQPGHVGIFIGGSQYIHSPSSGKLIQYGDLNNNKNFYGGRNLLD